MGNQCCSDRAHEAPDRLESPGDQPSAEPDEPSAKFARVVSQHVDLHAKVKETYYIYKYSQKHADRTTPQRGRAPNCRFTISTATRAITRASGKTADPMATEGWSTMTAPSTRAASATGLPIARTRSSSRTPPLSTRAPSGTTRPTATANSPLRKCSTRATGSMTCPRAKPVKSIARLPSTRATLSTAKSKEMASTSGIRTSIILASLVETCFRGKEILRQRSITIGGLSLKAGDRETVIIRIMLLSLYIRGCFGIIGRLGLEKLCMRMELLSKESSMGSKTSMGCYRWPMDPLSASTSLLKLPISPPFNPTNDRYFCPHSTTQRDYLKL